MPAEKPPASWFNWLLNRAYKSIQELQSKAESKDNKGSPGGYAALDEEGNIPIEQLGNMPDMEAGNIEYSGTESGLDADNIQDAIDENAANHARHLADDVQHTSILTTKGDIIYHNGTGITRLPSGSTGQVLKVKADGSLEWGSANVIKSIQRGVIESSSVASVTINSVDISKSVLLVSGDGYAADGNPSSIYAILSNATTITFKMRSWIMSEWVISGVASVSWQVIEFN